MQFLNEDTFDDGSDDDTTNNDFDIEDLHIAKPMIKGLMIFFQRTCTENARQCEMWSLLS